VPLTVETSHVVRDVPRVGVPRQSPVGHVRGRGPGAGAGCGWIGILAQAGRDGTGGCRITVDGKLKAERIAQEANAFTFSLLKAA
jgi:hypothetical protein